MRYIKKFKVIWKGLEIPLVEQEGELYIDDEALCDLFEAELRGELGEIAHEALAEEWDDQRKDIW